MGKQAQGEETQEEEQQQEASGIPCGCVPLTPLRMSQDRHPYLGVVMKPTLLSLKRGTG